MTTYTKDQILELTRAHNVQFIDMQFSDICGSLKAVTIPVSKLADALEHYCWFDGSSIEGFTRIFESDMYLKPDLGTFAILPWTKGTNKVTARFICDVYMPDGSRFEGDPRYVLEKQVKRAEALGYTYYVGPELEFFLFKPGDNQSFKTDPHDVGGYFDQTLDLAADLRKEMTFALQAMDIDVEALHHEVAVGQHEIDFKYGTAIKTADNAITFRHVLKELAFRHGLQATFMPKPIGGINGSGMHVHQSIFSGSSNLFFDANDSYKLSKMAKSFIAGQMQHIKALNAILNPLVNSYKRLVVGYEAPVNVAWASRNRSALIRIPRTTAGREAATRVELRCPDPSANPYLTFAVMLAAGLDGIEKDMQPPAPVEENIYDFNNDELNKRQIGSVAANLEDALNHLAENSVIRAALGEHTYESFDRLKRSEWDSYRMHVTDWEKENYLPLY